MLNETCVASGMVWSWQPGRGLRTSEPTQQVSDGERVHRTLKRIAKARAHLDAQEAEALRDAQRIRLWEQFGYTSLVDYMERELGYTARAAVERVRVAIAIEVLPQFEAALDQGTLSFSGAKELTRVVTPETQEAWLEAVHDKNVRQIEEMVSGHKPGDVPSDPVDESLRTKVLRFEVKLDTAELIRDYQKKRARQLGKLIDDDLLLREVFQLALDRLVEQRRRGGPSAPTGGNADKLSAGAQASERGSEHLDAVVESPSEASTASASQSPSRIPTPAPRYQLAAFICDGCKRGWLNAAGKSTLLAPAELACAQCDCDEIGRVDIAGEARKRASIPPATKRKVLARDRHRCRVQGCRSTNIDVHHIRPRALGGSHDESNLITLCEAHHLAIHRGTLVLRGSAIDATFTLAGANRFTTEARVVETKAALRRRGISKEQAAAVVDAVRTHVGTEPLSSEDWLRLAVERIELRP